MNTLSPFANGPGGPTDPYTCGPVVNNSNCGPNYDPTVAFMLGNAYQVVKYVALNMPFLQALNDNLSNLILLADSTEELLEVQSNLPALLELQSNLSQLLSLQVNLTQIVAVGNNIDAILAVNENETNIQAILDNIAAIELVGENIVNITAAGENIAAINAVVAALTDIQTANANIADISTVAGSIASVNAVATNLVKITNVSDNMETILAVEAKLPELEVIADDIERIVPIVDGLSEPNGSNSVMYLSGGIGAVPRSLQAKLREYISITDFGAISGTNCTLAINAAMQAAYTLGLPLFFPPGQWKVSDTAGAGAAIINPGVSCFGASKQRTMIVPDLDHPNTSDIFRVSPGVGVPLDFLFLREFMIYPSGLDGTARGKTALSFYMNGSGINAGCMKISGLHLLSGNDWSIYMENNGSANFQGNPSNIVICENSIWDGIAMVAAGDNVRIVDNVIRTSDGSVRPGIVYSGVNASGGVPAGLHIARNAMNCTGGLLLHNGGHMPVVEDNNYEQDRGPGTPSGAIIEFTGALAETGGGRIANNAFGVWGETTIGSYITMQKTTGMHIYGNRALAGKVVARGVTITSTCKETRIGSNQWGTQVTTVYEDNGVGTTGVFKPLVPNPSFSQAAGGNPLGCFEDELGQVRLQGLVDHPGLNIGGVLTILPEGKRPFFTQYFVAYGLTAAGTVQIDVIVAANGQVTVNPKNNMITRVSLAGITFLTTPTISSNV